MAKYQKKNSNEEKQNRPKSPTTPDGKEKQMIAYAMDLAEEQLRNGKASSQLITHFLKLGTENAKLERLKLEQESRLLAAKVETLKNAEEKDVDYSKVIKALKHYQGQPTEEDEEDYYED